MIPLFEYFINELGFEMGELFLLILVVIKIYELAKGKRR